MTSRLDRLEPGAGHMMGPQVVEDENFCLRHGEIFCLEGILRV